MSTERNLNAAEAVLGGATAGEPATTSRARPPLRVVAPAPAGEAAWRAVSLARLERPYARYKDTIERIVGSVLFVVSLPLMMLVALLIRLRMGPGVLYGQERIGRDGRVFRILKFRTMDTDRRSNDLEFVGEDRRRTHKTEADPRHTGLGRLLRMTSLDELPQLWNVVRGEMVLVGPRPELASVVDQYDLRAHPRHLVKPGITGLWQVSEFRHDLLHEHMEVDLDYIETLSLRTDLRILAQTVLMPFARTGH